MENRPVWGPIERQSQATEKDKLTFRPGLEQWGLHPGEKREPGLSASRWEKLPEAAYSWQPSSLTPHPHLSGAVWQVAQPAAGQAPAGSSGRLCPDSDSLSQLALGVGEQSKDEP